MRVFGLSWPTVRRSGGSRGLSVRIDYGKQHHGHTQALGQMRHRRQYLLCHIGAAQGGEDLPKQAGRFVGSTALSESDKPKLGRLSHHFLGKPLGL